MHRRWIAADHGPVGLSSRTDPRERSGSKAMPRPGNAMQRNAPQRKARQRQVRIESTRGSAPGAARNAGRVERGSIEIEGAGQDGRSAGRGRLHRRPYGSSAQPQRPARPDSRPTPNHTTKYQVVEVESCSRAPTPTPRAATSSAAEERGAAEETSANRIHLRSNGASGLGRGPRFDCVWRLASAERERAQRAASRASSASTTSLSWSAVRAPLSGMPFTKKAGVPVTPAACPASKSAWTKSR